MADVPNAELLLQDIAWLNRLATSLARDRDDADDLVQDAMIAAWQRQPDASRPMRAWFTKVVRDLAGMKQRGDRRRAARHAVADEPQAAAAPDELLAQLRLHKVLVDLVLELDEPYRSTVIARFVEGRTSASIAESLGIPAGTVRKRLHEALSRLRAALDANNAGDRKRWAPAVLAFARGGVHVAKPTKLVVAVVAALLIATTVAITIVLPIHRDRPDSARSAQTIAASSATPPSGAATATDDPRARPSVAMGPRATEHAAMLAAITRARQARERGDVSVPVAVARGITNDESTGTVLDITDRTGDGSEWQKRALGTVNKLFGQCYDLGRAEDPELEGTIGVRFRLVGEPRIGGVLESVDIIDTSTTLTQQTIRDCLTQQLYALELDPPPDGVAIEREITIQVP